MLGAVFLILDFVFSVQCVSGNYGIFLDSSRNEFVGIVQPKVYSERRKLRQDINSNCYYETEQVLKIVEIQDWILELDKESNGLIKLTQTEWISDLGTLKRPPWNECEYRYGHVRGFSSTSSAALSFCSSSSEIMGYFTFGLETFFIEPQWSDSSLRHFLYKKAVRFRRSTSEKWEYFNLTGDIIDIGGGRDNEEDFRDEGGDTVELNGEEDVGSWRREDGIDSEELGYFYDSAWQPNIITRKKNGHVTSSPQRWLEVAIAVDNTVITFHGKKRVEQYVLSLMNIVNAIYQDPSLDANIQLVVSRLQLYEHRRQSVVKPGNARKSLENVNAWNKDVHASIATGEPHHDVALWLTRSDIGGPSGYAPVSGACDPERSCALNRDEGLTSAFIIAHEMAHILGLTHDGDAKSGNDCRDEALQGSVMAPMVSSTFHQFLWSSCSRNEFKTRASKWKCLLNQPSGTKQIWLNATLQTTFSMDEQCRMEFGEGYMLCRAFDIVEPCSHLWCGHVKSPLVCKTKKGPPLEGTECGFDKWCISGYCETVDKRKFNIHPVQHNPQDGGWSEWSPWGFCSRTCGTGVQFRVRKCDNPAPIYGGSDCFGSKEEWQICNTNPCPEPQRDIRAQQCKRLPKLLQLTYPRNKLTWLPFESDQFEMKCKLICVSQETKETFITGENLIDGTPCSYENQSNICLQGTCQTLGCDKKLFSEKREDACGVCGGNNSECSIIKSSFRRKLKRDVSRVAVMPKFAREIKIEANVSSLSADNPSVAFMLKDRRKNSVSITIPNTSIGNQIIEGSKFYYKKIGLMHLLWSKGPVLSEIVVLISSSTSQIENGLTLSLKSVYYIHKNMSDVTQKYQWILGGWGPCSQTCGGGKRFQTKACRDTFNNKIVPRKYCSIVDKPSTKSEKCNTFSCNFHWTYGLWETCSATCGSHGMQSREIYCVPQMALNISFEEPWKYMVQPRLCGDIEPPSMKPCNRRACPSFWEYSDWSQCSSSCGYGITIREPNCVQPGNETLYTCSELAPKYRKLCRGQFNRRSNPLCRNQRKCFGDSSKYCALPLLGRYCKINAFKKLCCKTCAKLRLAKFTH